MFNPFGVILVKLNGSIVDQPLVDCVKALVMFHRMFHLSALQSDVFLVLVMQNQRVVRTLLNKSEGLEY